MADNKKRAAIGCDAENCEYNEHGSACGAECTVTQLLQPAYYDVCGGEGGVFPSAGSKFRRRRFNLVPFRVYKCAPVWYNNRIQGVKREF